MKKQFNFKKYLEEKYGQDYRVSVYKDQYVQLVDNNSKETLNFHFNKKGFFNGAFYKQSLFDKGQGVPLMTFNKEKKIFMKTDFVINGKMGDIYKDIYNEMKLDEVILNLNKKYEGRELKDFLVKLDNTKIFALDNKTFISKDMLTDYSFERIQKVNGVEAVPLNETEFKDREVFELKDSKTVLLVDKEGLKAYVNRIGDIEICAKNLIDLYPNISYDEAYGFIEEIYGVDKEFTQEQDDYEMEM